MLAAQHLGGIWVGLGAVDPRLQGLSEAGRLEGAFGGCCDSASGGGGKEGGGGGQRKLWAPPAGEDLERLQTIVSGGQAFSAGRGGLQAPLPRPHIWWAGLARRSWEEQLWSGLSLVTGLRGWGQPAPQGLEWGPG